MVSLLTIMVEARGQGQCWEPILPSLHQAAYTWPCHHTLGIEVLEATYNHYNLLSSSQLSFICLSWAKRVPQRTIWITCIMLWRSELQKKKCMHAALNASKRFGWTKYILKTIIFQNVLKSFLPVFMSLLINLHVSKVFLRKLHSPGTQIVGLVMTQLFKSVYN